jgi:5-methyltetrahydrofolate--homocysteine methyltransferase
MFNTAIDTEQNLQALRDAVISGNRTEAKRITQMLLEQGLQPTAIVDTGLVPGMFAVGERFKRNEAFVPEMLVAARAMKEAMALIEPLLAKAGIKPKNTAVIGTVQGDLHDIGKNLVGMMWKGANIAVVDLGTNVPPERFVAAAREHRANIVGLSALLTTTMPSMKQTVEVLKSAGLNGVQVLIGGAPITQQFANEIGADGYAPDAASAVDVAMKLVAA